MRKGRLAPSRPSPSEEPWRGHMVFNMAFSDLVWVGLFITAVAAAAYLFPRTTEAWPIWWYCLGTAAAIAVVRWVIRPIYQWWSRYSMRSYRMLALLLFILTSHAVVGKKRSPFPSPLAHTIYSSPENPTEEPWRCNYKLVLGDLLWVSLFITAVASYLFPADDRCLANLVVRPGHRDRDSLAPMGDSSLYPMGIPLHHLGAIAERTLGSVLPRRLVLALGVQGGYLTNERRPDSYCRFVNKDRNKPELEVYTEWADLPAHVADQLFNQSVREGNILW
ncbi:unnamed protein product, partial [Mesorhabditis spiculigera]